MSTEDGRCTCEARSIGECMCGAWRDDYTPRELRLMAERDAALTRAESAESFRDAPLNIEIDQLRYELRRENGRARAAEARCDALKAALREACDVAQAALVGGPGNRRIPYVPDAERIAELRKLADP